MNKVLNIFLGALLLSFSVSAQAPREGDPVPVFELKNQDGEMFKLSDYIGKQIIVIYFYPKDDDIVCREEAKGFRDSYQEFSDAGALVVGINDASVSSHKKFHAKYSLPFDLLSDKDHKIRKTFKVPMGITGPGRHTFVVDLTGTIVYAYNNFLDGEIHVKKAVEKVREMKANSNSRPMPVGTSSGTVRM